MTLQQLTYFKTLAYTLNMHESAEALYITQPSLSIAMHKLEEELGVTLFLRSGKRLALTKEGRALLEHAEIILKESDECLSHMRKLSFDRNHRILLGSITPLLSDRLPFCIRRFLENPQNTGIEFDIREGTSPQLIELLKKDLLDFVICTGHEDEMLENRTLHESELCLLLPESPDIDTPADWDALLSLPFVGYTKDSAMDDLLNDIWKKIGKRPQYRYRMPNESSIVSMVEAGLGAAIIPDHEHFTGRLIRVLPLPCGRFVRRITITTLRGQSLSESCERFIRFASAELYK